MSYTWEYSENAENWRHDIFDTIEDCIEDAKANYDVKTEDTIAIGEVEPFEVYVDARDVLERLEEEAYEACGECTRSWMAGCGKEAEEELSEKLTEIVKIWLEEHNNEPTFYRIVNIKSIEVN